MSTVEQHANSDVLAKYEAALRAIASLRLDDSLGPHSMALEAVHIAKTAIDGQS